MFSDTDDQQEARAEWIEALAANTGLTLFQAGEIAKRAAMPGNLILTRTEDYPCSHKTLQALRESFDVIPDVVLALKDRQGEILNAYVDVEDALQDLAMLGFPVEMHFYDVTRTTQ